MDTIAMYSLHNNGWADFFMGIEPAHRWLLLVVAISCAMGVTISLAGIVMKSINSIQRHRAETELKREMIERGMSADEIAKVIEASSPNKPV